jgi:hypothetical protein
VFHALIIIAFALVVGVVLVAFNCHHRRESAKFVRERQRFWWSRRKQDRDDLLDTPHGGTAHGGFRYQRPAQWGKPYAQPIRPPRPPGLPGLFRIPHIPHILRGLPAARSIHGTTWTTMQLYWWATEHAGLVHRVSVLKYDHSEAFVLRCDHDALLAPTMVDQFPVGTGPMLTCVRCLGAVGL